MKNLLLSILSALALPAFGQPPPPAKADDPTAAITQLREGLVTSFKKGDIEGLLSYLDPEVVVTWQNGELCHGPAAVRAFYERMMMGERRVVRAIKSEPEVLGRHIYGDWAVSWGNLHDHFVLNDGSDLPFNSVFTAVTAKRGDRWLVTGFHTSVSAFDNPVVAVASRRTALWTGLGAGTAGLILGMAAVRLLKRRRGTA